MMRSLYSAVSGLKSHQTRMDVIGNNVANVNTTGFKRSLVNFSTVLSQTLQGASAPATDESKGGTNPKQIGLGVSVGAINQIMTQGSNQTTGVATNVMIDGSGFFMLSRTGDADSDLVYSRAGAFIVDEAGHLVDSATGAFVLAADKSIITIDIDTYNMPTVRIGIDGAVMAVDESTGEEVVVDGQYLGLAVFPNESGLKSIGSNFYQQTVNSGDPKIYGEGGADGDYPANTSLLPSNIEMSNVSLADEFTDMIITQRGFQANSRVITVSDTLLEELINLKR